MPLCKHNCGTNLTWLASSDGKNRPYGPDGQPHRCPEGLAAYRGPGGTPVNGASQVSHAQPAPYNTPQPRTEVQELRHAVQRLARAVELLTEAVQELSARELAR